MPYQIRIDYQFINGAKQMLIIVKNNELYVIDKQGKFIGKIINSIAGGCNPNPPYDEPGTFAVVFGGHGYIYHVVDNPPNPFFNKSWGEIFQNPELLPKGTKNVFIDQSIDCWLDFQATLVPA